MCVVDAVNPLYKGFSIKFDLLNQKGYSIDVGFEKVHIA